ncbi:hypothetical protein MKX01_042340 [Papaver californicum]|nr:hypothetical protein MKX01_042340 [Papaver californicum]
MLARKLSPFKFKHGFHLSSITSSSQVSKFQSLNSHLLSNFNSTSYNQYPEGNLDEPEKEKLGLPKATKFGSKPVVCARCHSLRYYGRVKHATVENLLPDFDFDHTIGRKLVSTSGARSVVLMVVDAADFDGSFPRKVPRLVSDTIDEIHIGFVRVRVKEELIRLLAFYLVGAVRGWGLKHLVDDVCKLAGARGNVWDVGAQNAGKSTLINSIGKHASGGEVDELTGAPVPGTTLGIIRVEDILPGQANLFDTPGLLHPHQLTTRLTREEQKLVQISKELKPRTYRIEETSLDTVCVTVWASPYLPSQMGKTENVETMLEHHFGFEELGNWVRMEFHVSGISWDVSSIDVSASRVGWFAMGLKGEARLGVWTYDDIDVTLRKSLIPQRSNHFEVSGFTVSKIVSQADRATSKQPQSKKQKKEKQRQETVPDSSSLPDKAANTSSC